MLEEGYASLKFHTEALGNCTKRKEQTMSNPSEHENQQTNQKAIVELSDEQLGEVTGGGVVSVLKGIKGTYNYAKMYQNGSTVRSAWAAIKTGRGATKEAIHNGYENSSRGVTNYIYDTQYNKSAKV